MADTLFRRPAEADAYRVLHAEGLDAFDDRWGPVARDLLNRWAERGMVRISYPDGSLTVRTFKKYAR